MAIDASIPLQGQQLRFPSPGEMLSLEDMSLRMKAQRTQMMKLAQLQKIAATPGMYEKGLPTDQGLTALQQIDPNLSAQAAAQRSEILGRQQQERSRAVDTEMKVQDEGRDKLDDMFGEALNTYYNTQGSEEVRRQALAKHVNTQVDEFVKSGLAAKYGWNEQALSKLRSTQNPDDILTKLIGHGKKELVTHFQEKQAAGADADPGMISLADVGKAPKQDAVSGDIPAPVKTDKGAVNLMPTPMPADPTQRTRDQEVRASGAEFPEQAKPEGFEVNAKRTAETPEGLRKQAQAKEAEAARLRKLGTGVGNKRAEAATKEAKDLRKASVDLEGKIQSEARLQMQIDRAKSNNQELSDEAVAFAVSQYLGGNATAIQGLARNQAAKKQILDAIPVMAKQRGMSPAAVNAAISEFQGLGQAQRTLGSRAANIDLAIAELKQFIPVAEKASDAVPRTGFVPVNKLMQMGTNQWSPEQAAFVAANRSMINAFAQLASRGVPTVHNTEEAEHMLNTAQTPEQYKAVLKQLWAEAEGARKAPGMVREDLRKAITGEPEQPHPYPGGVVNQAPPPKAQREVGKVYDTPKGKLKWTGTGWIMP